MKPKEFDELIRQKFDQNDFAYNPGHWDQLAEQMDGRARKRSAMMWWLMPLAGIAASVAMAMGVTTLLRQQPTGLSGANTAFVQSGNFEQPQILQNEPATTMVASNRQYLELTTNTNNNLAPKKNKKSNAAEKFAINLENAIGFTSSGNTKKNGFVLNETLIPKKDKKAVVTNEGYNTFKPEEELLKPTKTSIILSGGINRGSQSNGYVVGATVRRMLNDKVFIESDVAFASSNNSQLSGVPNNTPATARTSAGAARNTATEGVTTVVTPGTDHNPKFKDENVSYNLYYAQVSPSIGYKVIKKISIGVGPDFQQALADNRPTASTVTRNNVEVAPLFDVGFIGKTEYSITKKVKAGVFYRKGINNILTPMDKYIDRDYLQFQLKCTIFNK